MTVLLLAAVLLAGPPASAHGPGTHVQAGACADGETLGPAGAEQVVIETPCEHDGAALDCPPCPTCAGAVTAGPAALDGARDHPAFAYLARAEQFVPSRELPPPRHG